MSITADRIKELRKQNKLTQQQLAKIINSTSVTISRIESGTRNPSFAMLSLIADALDTNVLYLEGKSNFLRKINPQSNVRTHEQTIEYLEDHSHATDKNHFLISDLLPDEIEKVQEYVEFLKFKRNNNDTSSN